MVKINFKDVQVKSLDGTVIDFKAHEAVGNLLAKQSTSQPVKMMEMARTIYNEGEIQLSTEDIQLIKNTILSDNTFTNLVKEPILKALEG